jgi:hypothetical protein
MQCVANYEIRSELSVFEDGRWLKLQHPNGLFRARIRNIIRSDFSGPFLLSLHLAFDAPSLEEAKDVAEERLADCLNMLALTTGSAFVRHRIRQIVDGTPGGPMRSCLMWGDAIEHENPTPFLDDQIMASTERLLAFDAPPAVRQAMRWYRIGVNASIPDDQCQSEPERKRFEEAAWWGAEYMVTGEISVPNRHSDELCIRALQRSHGERFGFSAVERSDALPHPRTGDRAHAELSDSEPD